MHSVISDDDGAFVVQFLREQSGELCATLCLRAAVIEPDASLRLRAEVTDSPASAGAV